MSATTWKERLQGEMPEQLQQEIDAYETQLELKRQGRIDDKMFAEVRLRRGAYGQRYDNGQRHDGEKTQTLDFPAAGLTKGPHTMWDAPGMHRIKLPFGRMSIEQMEALAEVADEYSDSILHVTTRQDIQLHFVHIEDTPDLMRRLAAVGITTREACGNSVRNVTACPVTGVCAGESFDVSPYAHAITYFLLGHPDVQDFGRKFKIAFSGCQDGACGLTNFHDMGAIAKTRVVDGEVKRGFAVYVGGGLGAVPSEAKLLSEFVPEEELLPVSQAISRVFARLGEKANRSRARIKFLVKKLGIDAFRRLVDEERAGLRPDPRWTEYLSNLGITNETPLKGPGALPEGPYPEGFAAWLETNAAHQRQPGYRVVTVKLPLGDATSWQTRQLADMARRYTGDTVRTTVEQNVVFRWVSESDIVDFYDDLVAIGLAEAGAGTITDLTSCPGTDTCKLGISSSRGLAMELRERLSALEPTLDPAVKRLHIKASGCFNSCGQHHVADIGFLGVSRGVRGRRVPHFQLVIGGQWENNGGSYGVAVGAIPSKNVPKVVEKVTEAYVAERSDGETFQTWIQRVGKGRIRDLINPLTEVPAYEEDPSFYSDWGDPREYTVGDMGTGECAGEIVPYVEFGLHAGERSVFEAQLEFDKGEVQGAAKKAYEAMLNVAAALVRHLGVQLQDEPDEIVREFKAHLHETELFHDPFAGGKFAHYLFRTHEDRIYLKSEKEQARHLLEEAQLFIDNAHACYQRMGVRLAAVAADGGPAAEA